MDVVPPDSHCVTIRPSLDSFGRASPALSLPMPDSVHADRSSTQQATNESYPDRSIRRSLTRPGFVRGFCALGVAMVVGDLVTTVYGLEVGLREQNPVVLAVMERLGVAGLVALKLVAVSWVGIIWRVLGRHYGLAAMAGLMIPQGLAVVLNVVTILNV